jgi:hypothetical protein
LFFRLRQDISTKNPAKIFIIKDQGQTENKKKKVIEMIDLSNETIEHLFYNQIKEMTRKTVYSFEMQFSDRWLRC